MSKAVATLVNERKSSDWHNAFLADILPAVQITARVRFRGLPAVEREEATAEAVAGAVVSFVSLIRRSKNPAAFATRLARIAVLRVLAGRLTGTADNSNDVLSRLARQNRGFTVGHFSELNQANGGWQEIIVEDRKCTPAATAASRIDFAAWLGQMQHGRRKIAETMAAGYETGEVADLFNLSASRISQLRRELEDSWREFNRESPGAVTTKCRAAR